MVMHLLAWASSLPGFSISMAHLLWKTLLPLPGFQIHCVTHVLHPTHLSMPTLVAFPFNSPGSCSHSLRPEVCEFWWTSWCMKTCTSGNKQLNANITDSMKGVWLTTHENCLALRPPVDLTPP